MIADPQINTLWELGLFMFAPVSLAIMLGQLLRWRDRRLELPLQDVWGPKTPAMTPTGPMRSPFESVEGSPNLDCNHDQSGLQTKVVT
jgi:hypothetical protein